MERHIIIPGVRLHGWEAGRPQDVARNPNSGPFISPIRFNGPDASARLCGIANPAGEWPRAPYSNMSSLNSRTHPRLRQCLR